MTNSKAFLGYTGQNTFGEFLLSTKPDVWGREFDIKSIYSDLEKLKKALPQGGRQGIYRVYRVDNALQFELN